jgi:hypothetical protein
MKKMKRKMKRFSIIFVILAVLFWTADGWGTFDPRTGSAKFTITLFSPWGGEFNIYHDSANKTISRIGRGWGMTFGETLTAQTGGYLLSGGEKKMFLSSQWSDTNKGWDCPYLLLIWKFGVSSRPIRYYKHCHEQCPDDNH